MSEVQVAIAVALMSAMLNLFQGYWLHQKGKALHEAEQRFQKYLSDRTNEASSSRQRTQIQHEAYRAVDSVLGHIPDKLIALRLPHASNARDLLRTATEIQSELKRVQKTYGPDLVREDERALGRLIAEFQLDALIVFAESHEDYLQIRDETRKWSKSLNLTYSVIQKRRRSLTS